MPLHVKSPESEFNALADRSTDAFALEFFPMLRAVARGDQAATRRARERIAKVLGQTMTLADFMGRRRALLEFDAAVSREPAASFGHSPVVPKVTFSEAYKDLLTREPRLAVNAEEVAELYRETHAFALAKSAEKAITRAVQGAITSSVKSGVSMPSTSKIVQSLGDFTRSYANTVYRTNLNTAYTAGRFQQAQEPGVRTVLPAMERWSVRDSSLRAGRHQDGGENHAAAHGLVAATTDRIWQTLAPPSGYGCRCGVRLVSVSELRKRGLLDANGAVIRYEPPGFGKFRAHANFGRRRPDLLVYGGGSLT